MWFMALWLAGRRPAREAMLVGVVERTIYFIAAYIGAYEIAAGWLVLKAWQEKSRAEHHWYLIGVGTSLIFGMAGGFIARIWGYVPVIPNTN